MAPGRVPHTSGWTFRQHCDASEEFCSGGHWKSTDSDIVEFLADGTSHARFKPVPAYLAPDAVQQLTARFAEALGVESIDPVALIATPCTW